MRNISHILMVATRSSGCLGRHARGQDMDGQLHGQENQAYGGELPYCYILLP